jgi:hypothetical protein
VITAAEEPAGDQTGAAECDITGIDAFNDANRLRITIRLADSMSMKDKVCYVFQIKGRDFEDGFGYMPAANKFYYTRWQNGQVVKDQELEMNPNADFARVGNVFMPDNKTIRKANCVVHLFIDKDAHLSKVGKGTAQSLEVKCYSGNYTKSLGDAKVADETVCFKLNFTR